MSDGVKKPEVVHLDSFRLDRLRRENDDLPPEVVATQVQDAIAELGHTALVCAIRLNAHAKDPDSTVRTEAAFWLDKILIEALKPHDDAG